MLGCIYKIKITAIIEDTRELRGKPKEELNLNFLTPIVVLVKDLNTRTEQATKQNFSGCPTKINNHVIINKFNMCRYSRPLVGLRIYYNIIIRKIIFIFD